MLSLQTVTALWLAAFASPAAALPSKATEFASLPALPAQQAEKDATSTFPLLPPATFETDVPRSEDANGAADKAMESTFAQGLRSGQRELLKDALASGFSARWPLPADMRRLPDSTLALGELGTCSGPDQSSEALVDRLWAWTSDWVQVERCFWSAYRFLLSEDGESAFASIHFQLAGVHRNQGRQALAADLNAELVLVAGQWKLKHLEWKHGWFSSQGPPELSAGAAEKNISSEGDSVAASKPGFRPIGAATGLRWNESGANRAILQSLVNDRSVLTIGSLAAVDWNRDGYWDVLATQRERATVLFENDGHGGFIPKSDPADIGIQHPTKSPYVLVSVDLNGDDSPELISGHVNNGKPTLASASLFTRTQPSQGSNSPWMEVGRALQFEVQSEVRRQNVQAIAPADWNGDGLLDLFFCVYSDSRSGGADYNTFDAQDGGENLLFINRSKAPQESDELPSAELSFSEEAVQRGIQGRRYSYIAEALDADLDGTLDLFVGNDFGPNELYLNDGKGFFKPDPESPLAGDCAYTMGISLADVENDGRWEFYFSNMYSHAGNRIAPLAGGLSDTTRKRVLAIAQGGRSLRQEADGSWTDVTHLRGSAESGWSWGSSYCDIDNDGDQDLLVVNGYTSHTDAKAPDY